MSEWNFSAVLISVSKVIFWACETGRLEVFWTLTFSLRHNPSKSNWVHEKHAVDLLIKQTWKLKRKRWEVTLNCNPVRFRESRSNFALAARLCQSLFCSYFQRRLNVNNSKSKTCKTFYFAWCEVFYGFLRRQARKQVLLELNKIGNRADFFFSFQSFSANLAVCERKALRKSEKIAKEMEMKRVKSSWGELLSSFNGTTGETIGRTIIQTMSRWFSS